MSSATRKVILQASDDVVFEIDEAVAFQSVVIKFAIEDCHDNYIRLPNVTSKILEKVIDYCKRHLEAEESPYQQARDDLKAFDAEFVKVDQATLFDLIQILEKLVEYCKRHVEDEQSSPYKRTQEDLKAFDFQFVKVDHSTLFDLIHAANCLNIKSLLNLTCGAVQDMIKGKTPEEIRKIFNIKIEFTPDEKEEVRRNNDWAFE